MSAVKRYLEDMLCKMRYEERIRYLMTVCGYGSEDAKDYAQLYEPNDEEAE